MAYQPELGGSSSATLQHLGEVTQSLDTNHPLPEGDFLLEKAVQDIITLRGVETIAHAKVGWHYIGPADSRELTSPHPIAIIPGFGASEAVYTDLGEAFARRGKGAITFETARSQTGYSLSHLRKPGRLASQSAWAAMRGVLRSEQVLEQHGAIEKFDVFAHSWGGDKARQTALRHSERIRSMILAGAVGLEDHNTLGMVMRGPGFLFGEFAPAVMRGKLSFRSLAEVAISEAYHLGRDPVLTLREGREASKARVTKDLPHIIGDLGIPVGALLFASDKLIPPEPSRAKSIGELSLFRVFPDAKVGHLGPNIPEYTQAVADEALDMLDHINASQSALGNPQAA